LTRRLAATLALAGAFAGAAICGEKRRRVRILVAGALQRDDRLAQTCAAFGLQPCSATPDRDLALRRRCTADGVSPLTH
jgi:hypothetical protein